MRASAAILMLGSAVAMTMLAPRPATAGPLLELAGGLNAPNPLTPRFMGRSAHTTYFNPALLPDAVPAVDLSFFVLSEFLWIDLQARPAGLDISGSIYEVDFEQLSLANRPKATADLPGREGRSNDAVVHPYLGIGLVKPIFKRHLVLGVYVVLPTAQFLGTHAHFADEREQYFSNSLHFELFEDRLRMPTVALALGGEVTDWLALGIGVTVYFGTVATTTVFLPDVQDQANVVISAETNVHALFAPHFAITAKPSDCVSFGLTVHVPAELNIDGTNDVRFWSDDPSVQQHYKFTHGSMPVSVALGGSWIAFYDGQYELTLGGEALWQEWSGYHNRFGFATRDSWHDTISVSVGTKLRIDSTRLNLDFRYTPSPVPDQTGRDNYVDNDRVGIAGGVQVDFELFEVRFRLGFQLQAHILLERSTTKSADARHAVVDEFPDDAVNVFSGETFAEAAGLQTNNPGYPGFSSGGWLLGAGLTLTIEL